MMLRRGPRRGPLGALPALSRVARRALAGIGVLSLLGAGLLVAQAFLLAGVLASVVAGSGDGLGPMLGWLAVVVVGRAVVAWATRVVAQRAAAGVQEELRGRTVDGALERGPEWIAAQGPGELTDVATRGLEALDAYFTEYLPALVTASVVPLAAAAAVLYADWPSAVIIALTVPLLPVFAVLVGKHTEDRVRESTSTMQRLSGQLLELVRALPVLTAFGRASAQADAVRRLSERHRAASVATMRVAFSSAFVLEFLATLSVALVAVVIGVRLVSGDMALAVGLGVLILAPECYQPIRRVGAAFHASQDGVDALGRVAGVLAPQAPLAAGRECASGLEHLHALTTPREVEVSGLRVQRRSARTDPVSFVARPGEIAWLRSPSGAGKSTTLAALLGFVRPAAGTITACGRPLDDWDPAEWRRNVAWVPQFPVLTETTVRAELAAATGDGTRSALDTEIRAVAGRLAIEDLLDRGPATLSTGQRQRVAVARALLRVRHGAWLLVLDEPTAHLDEEHAALVMGAVWKAVHAGAAAVLAAHTPGARDGGSKELWSESFASKELCANSRGANGPLAPRPLPLRDLVDRRLLAGVVLGALTLTAGVALTATSAWLIAKAAQQPPMLTLTVAIVGVRAFGLGRAVLRYVERLVTHDAALRAATRWRVRLWEALVRRGPVRALAAGEDQLRLVHDVDEVRDLVPRVVAPPLAAGLAVAFAVTAQTLLSPLAGAVLAGAMVVGGGAAVAVSNAVERQAATRLSGGRRAVRARVLEMFDAAAELIAFGRIRGRRAELARADGSLARAARRSALAAGVADAVVVLAAGLAAVACAGVGAAEAARGAIDPVVVPVLALVPLALAEVIAQFPDAARRAEPLRHAAARLADATAAERRLPGIERKESVTHSVERTESVFPHIELRGATVRWPGADTATLRDVDLRIPAGSRVTVIGESGAGKSTLLATLLGFLQAEAGTVVRPSDVVWAPQDPHLVATTLAENLRLGDPHADAEAMAAALRGVRLDELATRLDLVLDSGGAGLSGGQARRVSLARALLAARRLGPRAPVLLDEPTAHLDAGTKDAVLRTLHAELAAHTVVHVTHDLAHTAGSDLALEVKDGHVRALVSKGTWTPRSPRGH